MDYQLQDKTAVITGASRGIGKSIAEAFAAEGAKLALVARGAEDLEKVAASIAEAHGVEVKTYPHDVSDGEAVTASIQKIKSDFGRLDILVNNAGLTRDGLLMRLKESDWDDVLNVNLKSLFHWCKGVYRIMLKQKAGRIINVTSVVGLVGNAGQSNYAASKAGMVGFTKSLAKELGARGITVNAVAPGFVETDMTAALSSDLIEKTVSNIPLGRLGRPEEVAASCLFLAGPQAGYITGTVLQVDGGLFM